MRNRYLDLLRAAAIVRVIVYHLFGWPWLSILLPAMGIMFALAGSLTAASLDKRGADQVVISRLRRLLPPLWLLGLIAVPVMLAAGWAQEHGQNAFSLARLGFWILPIGDPPGSDKGVDLWEPLWYIRAYLWFVVLSPIMYLAYKKIGWGAVAAPLGIIVLLDATGLTLPTAADAAMWDFVTYGACWIAGFAHHDGRLARLKPPVVLATAVVLGAAALYWLAGHAGTEGYDLNDVSESQALWSLAFVLVALRWQPSMAWLDRARPLDRAVTLLNGRAVTIYLWHNIAIAAVWPVLTILTLDDLGRLNGPVELLSALVLTAGAVLAFGWAEDLAARRRPRLWPATDTPSPTPNSPLIDPPPLALAPSPRTTPGAAGTAISPSEQAVRGSSEPTSEGPSEPVSEGLKEPTSEGLKEPTSEGLKEPTSEGVSKLASGGDPPVAVPTLAGRDRVAAEFAPPHRPDGAGSLYASGGTGSGPPAPEVMAERLRRQWQTDQQHMAEPFRGGSAPRPANPNRLDHHEAPGTSPDGSASRPVSPNRSDRSELPATSRGEAAAPAQRHTELAEPTRTESDQGQRRPDGGPVPRSRGETTAARQAAAAAWFRGDGDSP